MKNSTTFTVDLDDNECTFTIHYEMDEGFLEVEWLNLVEFNYERPNGEQAWRFNAILRRELDDKCGYIHNLLSSQIADELNNTFA